MTYPLGWSIIPQMLIQRERWPGGYEIRGSALVYPGQEVHANQPVMRLEKPDSQAAAYHGMQKGGHTDVQQSDGIILAGMSGRVVDITRRGGVIIETRAAIIQGTIGAGNQVAGILTFWNSNNGSQHSGSVLDGTFAGATFPIPTIFVVPGPLNFAMLLQAMNIGVAGIVASSISSRDLEDFLGTNLIALLNSMDIVRANMFLPRLTVLLTEGLGTVAMPARTIHLLSKNQGSMALLSGMTFLRQAIYPELIISLPVQGSQQNWRSVEPDPRLFVGSQVRILSGSYEGATGEITYLYIYMQTFASSVRGRAARVRLEDGSTLIMPLFLLERIG